MCCVDRSSRLSKPEILTASRCFPLYPSKRTSGGRAGMSVQCQKATLARREGDRRQQEVKPLSTRSRSSRTRPPSMDYWFLIEAETVRNLCGHQHADVMVLVQLGDLALKHAGSFGSNDWIGEAMKLGHEAPALAVQISIRDRHVESNLSRFGAAGLDHDVGISACTAIPVHDQPLANLAERRIKGVLI